MGLYLPDLHIAKCYFCAGCVACATFSINTKLTLAIGCIAHGADGALPIDVNCEFAAVRDEQDHIGLAQRGIKRGDRLRLFGISRDQM